MNGPSMIAFQIWDFIPNSHSLNLNHSYEEVEFVLLSLLIIKN